MAKTITIHKATENKIVSMCKDELNYHIHESGCVSEYKSECEAQIFLLKNLGYEDEAADFSKKLRKALKEDRYSA